MTLAFQVRRAVSTLRSQPPAFHHHVNGPTEFCNHRIKQYNFFHNKRHPKEMGAEEIRAFLTHLEVSRNVAASTQNQALNDLVFLYKAVVRIEPGYFVKCRSLTRRHHALTLCINPGTIGSAVHRNCTGVRTVFVPGNQRIDCV